MTAGTRPAEVTPLDKLTVALRDPEVVRLLDDKSIDTIALSKGSYPERDRNYTQIVFRPPDPDPDDRMATPMIVVQINDFYMVYSVYETYPPYIPEAPRRHRTSNEVPAPLPCSSPSSSRWPAGSCG